MEPSELKSLKPGTLLETTESTMESHICAVLITKEREENNWIPTGSIVMFLKYPVQNFLGWTRVLYDEKKYYILPENLKIAKER